MSTAANIRESEASHWYTVAGEACYEVPKKDGKGMTKTTLRHAREMNLLPSVTTILKILDKPALTAWRVEQAVLAVITSPRLSGEQDDAFIKRVLSTDKEQDQERDAAAQLGTDVHDAIEKAVNGQAIDERFEPFVQPVLIELQRFGPPVFSEKILVGDGFAGRCDLCTADLENHTIIDFKTTKNLPKQSYPEHKMQLAAYAKASGKPVNRTANIYISTLDVGQIKVCENLDIDTTYEAFQNLLKVWQWMNSHIPKQ